ncbi:MAG: SCP2 sterol-binding domain-containing protein [Butyrivibrio sp.]|nr:SCP2 sterol-binding domain-containing protein [Butyrivibrio sp.]
MASYSEIVKEAKKTLKLVDKANIKQHLAVEIDITGEGEGAFYIEFDKGSIKVEPYEYYDRDLLIRAESDVILGFLSGKLSLDKAKESAVIEGSHEKTVILKDIFAPVKLETKKEESKKIGTKKEESKKIATKKEDSKKIATKKEDSKKISTKKEDSKKLTTKKEESKKIATKKTDSPKISTTKK